ncbi:murein L,D-transpeptidase catalytic domain family protein [Candidatus Micrarchaeota archaeon]|jgi:hypothetical protein|nr:murein L,D-transpeptidase catalytic domain family protein [Candidatus Micrarchaeota archaeon]
MGHIKQTYWESKVTATLTKHELELMNNFGKYLNIPIGKRDLLHEAFWRAKDSIIKSNLDLENMGEPKRTQLLEVIAYVWYLEGYANGKNIVNTAIESFKQEETIEVLISSISTVWAKEKIEKMLKDNENRYTQLTEQRIKLVPKFLEGYLPKENFDISSQIETEIFQPSVTDTDRTFVSTDTLESAAHIVDVDTIEDFLEKGKKSVTYWIRQEYEKFNAQEQGLSFECFEQAIVAYLNGLKLGEITRSDFLTIIDYSLPSYEKRLFVLNMENKKIENVLYVSHGAKKTEKSEMAEFSNIPNDNKSSMGLAVTLVGHIIVKKMDIH